MREGAALPKMESRAFNPANYGSVTMTIRVLCADDHPLVRAGIAAFISAQSDMALVGEAGSGREAIRQFREHRPDVTLMDLQMPDLGGLQAITVIRSDAPSAKIIVLTTYEGDMLARRAFEAGAEGYWLKGLLREELLETIREVHRGNRRIHPEVAVDLAQQPEEAALTPREVEVLNLVATGNSNKHIAARLSIGFETAKTHVKSILTKLKASDRTHAVLLGLRRGIIDLRT
jgi:DNA-binding NarL/FixJ family response regulator